MPNKIESGLPVTYRDPAAKAAERIARRKALWECYRLGGNGAVVPSGLFLSAMDEFGHEAARAEHLESVLAKVRRRCAMVLKGDSYSLFQKQFAESILNESGEAAGGSNDESRD